MGWGYGVLGGREVGYNVRATCEHPFECSTVIDRGLAYACGGMHGTDEGGCTRYVCVDHQYAGDVCAECAGLDAAGAAAIEDRTRNRIREWERQHEETPLRQSSRQGQF